MAGGGMPMTDGPVSRSRWNRRDFLKTSAAAAAGAYAMRWGPGLAADVPFEFDGSKFQLAAPEKYTVQFKLAEPRPVNFIMSAIASGWNVIVRKKTLEDNNYNLRKVEIYPGTGPFRSKQRIENEKWVMERNPNYWNKGLPYLDGIEFYHALPFSTDLGSSILSGRTDYIRITDPVTARKATEMARS